jgi:hypothetical protein
MLHSKSHAKNYVENANDLLDRMKLLASDAGEVPSTRSANRLKSAFEMEMRKLEQSIDPIAEDFYKLLDERVQSSLMRSLQSGAEKGRSAALSTVESWGAKNRRSTQERRPDKNGELACSLWCIAILVSANIDLCFKI